MLKFQFLSLTLLCFALNVYSAFVTGVTIESSCPTAVTISWSGTATEGFNVYRSTLLSGTKTFIGSTSFTKKTGVDVTAQAGQTYYYWVEAVDYSETYMSILSANTTVPYTLSTPLSPTASLSGNSVNLSWSYFNSEDGMYIYRSTDFSTYTLITTITNSITSSWVDNTILPGHSYTYKISAYNECGASSQSLSSSTVSVPSLPDLATDSLDVIVSHDTLYGRYIVANLGGQSSPTFRTAVSCNGTIISAQTTSTNLLSGYYFTFYFTYKTASQSNVINIYADYDNGVIETSEYNNQSTITKTALPTTAPVLTSPVDNNINAPLSITFAWNNPGGATSYHFQLSTDISFSTTVVSNSSVISNYFTASSLNTNTTYYWRVAAYNGGGKSVWSVINSFTTIPTIPSAPLLVSPADGIQAQSTNVLFNWSTVNNATSYRLQLAASSSFTSILIDESTLTTTSKVINSLTKGSTYYWRVAAINAGGTSTWSEVWSYRTVPPIADVPLLVTPINNSVDQPVNLNLAWNAVTGATTYRLQIATTSDFSTLLVDDSTLTLPSKSMQSLLQNTVYYWRVNSKNAGGTSVWSDGWSFRTVPPIADVPQLVTPINNSAAQPVNLDLIWNAVTGATTYRLQIATTSDFSICVIDDSTLTLPLKSVQSLLQNTVYYWRVNSKNAGGTSVWSEGWSFRTVPPIADVPQLVTPINNSAAQPVNLDLIWNAVTGATTYRLQIATTSDFSICVIDDSTLALPSKSVQSLLQNTVYYWRVNSKNAGGTSAWSDGWSFKTVLPLPNQVTLNSPSNKTVFTVDSVCFVWKKEVLNVDKYALEIYTDSLMTSMLFSDSSIVDTFKLCKALTNKLSYYWRVKAHNSSGWGSFSQISNFSVDIPSTAILPSSYSLNLTNFNSNSKWLYYTLPIQSHINIKIYNLQGKIVYNNSKHQNAGVYNISINLPTLSKGNYILVFQAGSFSIKKKFPYF